jgi:CubicO group peptidase (beta-lactamase class C family)
VQVDGLQGAAAVIVDGSVTLETAGGVADAETGLPCTSDTRFQIASVSKQMAAAAVLLLVERGALTLDEPIAKWFPRAARQWQQITLHHLLSHTSGIGHWGDTPGFDLSEQMDLEERLDLLQRAPLRTEPGAEWHYSSPGYLLVGRIVERVTDHPYATFLTEQIFTPLGLESITAGEMPKNAARGHRNGVPVRSWDHSTMAGVGEVWCTAADLARYTTAIHNGRLLSEASREKLVRPHTPLRGKAANSSNWLISTSYAYGLFVGTINGSPALFHTGDNPGYRSVNVWLPDHDAGIAVLTNDETVDLEHLVKQLHPLISKAARPGT